MQRFAFGISAGRVCNHFAADWGGNLDFFCAPGFRDIINSDSLRIAIVIVFTLMPNAEPLMKAVYIGWYMLFFLALITLVTLPQNVAAIWLLFLPSVLAAWTTPVAIVCLPLTAFRAWTAANLRERIWWAALSAALVAYPFTAEGSSGTLTTLVQDPDWGMLLTRCVGYRVFCFFFFGQTLMYPFPSEGWNVILACSFALVAICSGMAIYSAAKNKGSRLVRLSSVILLYLILGLPVMFVLRKLWLHFFMNWGLYGWRFNGRYFYCSTLLLVVFLGVAYERLWRDWLLDRTSRREWAAVLVIFWLSLHIISFRLDPWNIHTPWSHFTEQIRTAQTGASQSGKRELVYVANLAKGFDFELVVRPEPPK